MSEINLLGDLSELRASTVNFNIVIPLKGTSGCSAKPLVGLTGLKPFLAGRAYSNLVRDSLSVKVTGSVSDTRSINVHCCIAPTGLSDYPLTPEGVASVPGSCFAQHSVTSTATPVILGFPDGVATQLKPSPVWGDPPAVVYHFEILGGDQNSTASLKISGTLQVGGIGFVKTW